MALRFFEFSPAFIHQWIADGATKYRNDRKYRNGSEKFSEDFFLLSQLRHSGRSRLQAETLWAAIVAILATDFG